jgi:tartronate-semialdehyde synthase
MEAVAAVMASEGVDTVFGVPGAALLPLYAALRKSGTIKIITVRHPEGGTHAADGWARATGRVGVSIGTSDLAGSNMLAALSAAFADSVPLVCIAGQARTPARPGAEASTDLPPVPSAGLPAGVSALPVDLVEAAKPVTKAVVQLDEPAQAPWVFREAFRTARSGRPGPVLVAVPVEVQRGTCVYDPRGDAPLPVEVPAPRPHPVNAAVQLLLEAQRPIILAGAGVVDGNATDELRQLAEYLQVPVQVTLLGKGAFPENHPLFAGTAGRLPYTRLGNAAFRESDLVLAVGARFGGSRTGGLETYRQGRTFIHVDVDPTQIGRVFEPDLGIVGHPKPTLAALCSHARRSSPQHAPDRWVERVAHLRATHLSRVEEGLSGPARVFREIDEAFGRDAIFVTAIGAYRIWAGQLLPPVHRPRRHLVCGQAGLLGWEVPAALGAKSGLKDAPVVAVVGARSFRSVMADVPVAVHHRLPVVIVVLDDAYLEQARQVRQGGPGTGPRSVDLDLHHLDMHHSEGSVDHPMLMAAFGCAARRVERVDAIAGALRWATVEAEAAQLPVLVEIAVAQTLATPTATTRAEPTQAPDLVPAD